MRRDARASMRSLAFGGGEAYDAKAIVSNTVRKDARASVRSPKPGGTRSTSARWHHVQHYTWERAARHASGEVALKCASTP